jgi:hypothetical protein
LKFIANTENGKRPDTGAGRLAWQHTQYVACLSTDHMERAFTNVSGAVLNEYVLPQRET